MKATVGLIIGSGGAADALREDPIWEADAGLFPLPNDDALLRAFVHLPDGELSFEALTAMAKKLHRCYLEDNFAEIPERLRSWEVLNDDFRTATIEQARYSIAILEAAGFRAGRSAHGSRHDHSLE